MRRMQVPPLALASILTVVLGSGMSVPAALAQGECLVILDSFGNATPETVFSGNSGGITIFPFQFAGPELTVTRQVSLSEIGGFINNCAAPGCTRFAVQIWGSQNGVPDPSAVLATFPLSDDHDPLKVSYESAQVRFPLEPGTYFAMFVPLDQSNGYLANSATEPFIFHPEVVQLGTYHPLTGASLTQPYGVGVRILADCPAAVRLDVRPGGGPNQINPRGNGLVPVAIFSTADFDATSIDPATVRFGATGTEAAPERISLEAVDADGLPDLLLYFRSRQMGLTCATRTAQLRGETFAGERIEGSDAVKVLGCPGKR